jgi:hypothetical protein
MQNRLRSRLGFIQAALFASALGCAGSPLGHDTRVSGTSTHDAVVSRSRFARSGPDPSPNLPAHAKSVVPADGMRPPHASDSERAVEITNSCEPGDGRIRSVSIRPTPGPQAKSY